jgi:hypothetical protein
VQRRGQPRTAPSSRRQPRAKATILVRVARTTHRVGPSAAVSIHQEVAGICLDRTAAGPTHHRPACFSPRLRKLQKLCPRSCVTDHEFHSPCLSRPLWAYLPTRAEVEAFVADTAKNPTNETRLYRQLVWLRPEFGPNSVHSEWAVRAAGQIGYGSARRAAHKLHPPGWVERDCGRNMPYDELARTLLTAEGSTLQNPPANFIRETADTNEVRRGDGAALPGGPHSVREVPQSPVRTAGRRTKYHALRGVLRPRASGSIQGQDGDMLIFTARRGRTVPARERASGATSVPGMQPLEYRTAAPERHRGRSHSGRPPRRAGRLARIARQQALCPGGREPHLGLALPAAASSSRSMISATPTRRPTRSY